MDDKHHMEKHIMKYSHSVHMHTRFKLLSNSKFHIQKSITK